MDSNCFDVVSSIAIERPEIGITCSSTPSGARSHFYNMCVDKSMGYSQHYHPSSHNPSWSSQMEAELRSQLTADGYIHEVLAKFGTQIKGVFPKDKLDESLTFYNYAYNPLTLEQREAIKQGKMEMPEMFDKYSIENPAPYSPFRCMGVDWDKVQAGSSLLIMDYDIVYRKFRVVKRIEVPRSEYSYDHAVNMIIELNKIYNPAFIYVDAGAAEYQIERLHIYGDEHPETGLKNKVKRWQFKQSIDIIDPITGEADKKPMKEFMVNQLTLAFERSNLILSPFDDVLYSQLINYEVQRVNQNGTRVFTSENEHFVDALGLAMLAFVLEFKDLTNSVKDLAVASRIETAKNINQVGINHMFNSIKSSYASMAQLNSTSRDDDDELDRPHWVQVSPNYRSNKQCNSWGSRNVGRDFVGRSMW